MFIDKHFSNAKVSNNIDFIFLSGQQRFPSTVVAVILLACIIHMGTAMVMKVSTNLSFFFHFLKTWPKKNPYICRGQLPTWTGTKSCMSVYVTKDFLCKQASSNCSF